VSARPRRCCTRIPRNARCTLAQRILATVTLALLWMPGLLQQANAAPVAAPSGVNPPPPADRVGAREAADPDYRLGPEDVVEIAVWREDGLKKELLVRPDGAISFPLVGEVQAAERTAMDIQHEIETKLRKYLSDPVVSVTVLKVAAQKIYVIGRVNKPGEFVSGRYIDVLQALSMAGGLTPFASANDIRILRRKSATEEVIPFRYNDVVKGKNLEQNIILKPGDVVVVP